MTTARTQVLSLRVQIWVHVFFCTDGVLFCCTACAQCRQLGRVQKISQLFPRVLGRLHVGLLVLWWVHAFSRTV